MRKFIFLITASIITLSLQATEIKTRVEEVNNVAGNLSQKVSDTQATSLIIKGTMDARDFKFIADKMDNLSVLDMSEVSILAYENLEVPLFGTQFSYEANTIPQTACFGKPIVTLTLPKSIKTIGYAAFAGTGIKSVKFNSSIDSIAPYAFTSTPIEQINIGHYVKIGNGAFARCTALTNVKLDGGSIGNDAFLGCSSLAKIRLGKGVVSIGKGAFGECTAIKGIDWVDKKNITLIDDEAFANSGIENANFSDAIRLKRIGAFAFAGTPVSTVNLPPGLKELGDGAFLYATNLKKMIIPSRVKAISNYALAGTNIDNNNLMTEGLKSIGDYALYNLHQIKDLTIPATVYYIGTQAMAGMTGLQNLEAKPVKVPILGENVWAGVDQSQVKLNIHTKAYKNAAQWKEFKTMLSFLLGDVNNDAKINVGDATTLINKILGTEVAVFNPDAADLDKNDNINVSDVTALINMILTRQATTSQKTGEVNSDDIMSIDDISIKPGENRTIDINLNNSKQYSGLQFDLHLPEGLTLTASKFTSTSRSDKHTFLCETQANGTACVVGYNMSNTKFKGHDGSILRITVTADKSLASEAMLTIDNIVLATATGETYYANQAQAHVNNTTGINDMEAKTANAYAHNGILVIESQNATTAQLITLNGMTQDLLVEAGHNEYDAIEHGIYIVRIEGRSFKIIIK